MNGPAATGPSAETEKTQANRSADHPAAHAPAVHAHGGGGEVGHGSLREYVIGFVLSVVLTAIPFWLVMTGALHDRALTAIAILALAALQIVVHMICFLHMNSRAEGGWNLLALIFTIVLLAIAVTGSLWIMYHLDSNMMPMAASAMSQMP